MRPNDQCNPAETFSTGIHTLYVNIVWAIRWLSVSLTGWLPKMVKDRLYGVKENTNKEPRIMTYALIGLPPYDMVLERRRFMAVAVKLDETTSYPPST